MSARPLEFCLMDLADDQHLLRSRQSGQVSVRKNTQRPSQEDAHDNQTRCSDQLLDDPREECIARTTLPSLAPKFFPTGLRPGVPGYSRPKFSSILD